MPKFNSVEQYFAQLSGPLKERMETMRETIRKAAPKAEEVISYNMPAFRTSGVVVWYAAYPHHIGFYPTGSGIAAFEEDLTKYKSSKGAVQFPHDRPLPVGLIGKMVKHRVKVCETNVAAKELASKAAAKKTKAPSRGKTAR